jgi:pescadillo protein
MHLVADNNKEVEEDEETRVCKSLFKDLKFFLSREVSF